MKIHPRVELVGQVAEGIAGAAVATARAGIGAVRRATRVRRGATLRPGTATPVWNELAEAVRPFLKTRGEQVKLGRFLGVPRQRVHAYFRGNSQLPDAERTLQILVWLAARRAGRYPA